MRTNADTPCLPSSSLDAVARARDSAAEHTDMETDGNPRTGSRRPCRRCFRCLACRAWRPYETPPVRCH